MGNDSQKQESRVNSQMTFPVVFIYCLFTCNLFFLACVSQKFNLVFVVDGSGSIEYQGRGNFQRSKDFIIEIVKSFNIGKDETNVALVLYSSNAQIVFNLKKYYRLDNIVRAIQRMPYPNGRTKTGKALEEVRKHVFKGLKGDRKNVPKVVMVLTDGLSHDDVSGPARKLRDAGATIISLGVGCCYDEDELKEMATDPDEKHVLEVSFSALNDFKDVVREQICSGEFEVLSKVIPRFVPKLWCN